MNGVRIKSW
ncbi:hypothetical protein TIFTF001_055237, partial [Ficus carica]